MKSSFRLLAVAALLCSSPLVFGQSLNIPTAPSGDSSQPEEIRPAAAKSDSKTASTKKGAPAKNPNDPLNWGRNDVHKLAVMEVYYAGRDDTIMFEQFPNKAPLTVANFISNCEAGAYKGIAFHRAIDRYLVQTGDPLTADESKRDQWGTGGGDKTIPGEFSLPHQNGSVAMARRDDSVNPERRSNGYQFYFAVGDLSALNGSYSVFGQVISGMDLLQDIAKTPVDSNDCPLQRIEVKSIKVADHRGPLIILHQAGMGRKRYTVPSSAKGPFTRFLERIW
jgi:cyclophilin family peptidyl-prolyl cis-trans isomerase